MPDNVDGSPSPPSNYTYDPTLTGFNLAGSQSFMQEKMEELKKRIEEAQNGTMSDTEKAFTMQALATEWNVHTTIRTNLLKTWGDGMKAVVRNIV